MRKLLFIISLSFLVVSCAAQKNKNRKHSREDLNKNVTTPKPVQNTVTTTNKQNPEILKVQGVEFYRQNIGDASKNDNTISYGSIVTANPLGYKVSKTYFPAVAQNFRQKYIILHYTALDDDKSVQVLTERGVSAHYLVNDLGDNDIYQLVDENKRAYHSGISLWRNDKNLNDNSIGIEIVNMGYTMDENGKRIFQPFSDKQVRKVAALVKDIVDRYQIPPTNVLAHSDVAPTRKQDPGPKFPWKMLYDQYKVGMWYDDYAKNNHMKKAIAENFMSKQNEVSFIFKIQTDLQNFGYDIQPSGIWDDDNRKIVEAFQYHFRPNNYDGIVDLETYSILQALLEKYPR